MQRRYDVGDKPKVIVEFKNQAGVAAEPTLVEAAVKSPSGVTTVIPTLSITHDLSTNPATGLPYVGRYFIEPLLTEGNDEVPWWVRWEGTGAVTAAAEEALFVRVPNVVIP